MNEIARVIALDEFGAWVDPERRGACGKCSARGGCGTTLLNALYSPRADYLHVVVGEELHSSLQVGDAVEIALPDELVTSASAILYLVPLGLLLAGAVAGNAVSPGDAGTAAGGVFGLLLGMIGSRLLASVTSARTAFHPQLVRRLRAAHETDFPGANS